MHLCVEIIPIDDRYPPDQTQLSPSPSMQLVLPVTLLFTPWKKMGYNDFLPPPQVQLAKLYDILHVKPCQAFFQGRWGEGGGRTIPPGGGGRGYLAASLGPFEGRNF